jgi:hypothetical protein
VDRDGRVVDGVPGDQVLGAITGLLGVAVDVGQDEAVGAVGGAQAGRLCLPVGDDVPDVRLPGEAVGELPAGPGDGRGVGGAGPGAHQEDQVGLAAELGVDQLLGPGGLGARVGETAAFELAEGADAERDRGGQDQRGDHQGDPGVPVDEQSVAVHGAGS